MQYRIYVRGTYGYERVGGNYSVSKMLLAVKDLIDSQHDEILVIEYNIKSNSDFPCFLYTGNYEDYEEFYINYNPRVLRRVK
jgi:hypothetical protein